MQFQRPLQIAEGRALPVKIIAGVAHAEIPAVRVGAVGLVGGHQPDGPPQQLTAFRLGGLGQIVVGPGQFHIGGGGALLFGQRFQRLDDLLVFLRLMPQAALFQKVHGGAVLLLTRSGACILISIISKAAAKHNGAKRQNFSIVFILWRTPALCPVWQQKKPRNQTVPGLLKQRVLKSALAELGSPTGSLQTVLQSSER